METTLSLDDRLSELCSPLGIDVTDYRSSAISRLFHIEADDAAHRLLARLSTVLLHTSQSHTRTVIQ